MTVPSAPGQNSNATSQSRLAGAIAQGDTSVMKRACDSPRQAGKMECTVWYVPGVQSQLSGLGPPDFVSAYKLPTGGGSGQIVAAVDAYDQPNIASDIAAYDSNYSLPAAKFTKYNQKGQTSNYPSPNQGWGLEESLDVEMLSAGCNACTIYLVEANSNNNTDLAAAVTEAAKLGATVISNSYQGGAGGGGGSAYNIPGVTILASAGDGAYGTGDPADFSSVIAVGGTVLMKASNSRGWTENTWKYTGSGCSISGSDYTKPPWQKPKQTPGCANKVNNDVSAVAANTEVYDTYGYSGFVSVAGTSISSPLMGSLFGLAGNSTHQTGGKTFWEKKHHKHLFDITSGSNGTCTPSYLCTAGPGYDGPTGWGSPNGIGAF